MSELSAPILETARPPSVRMARGIDHVAVHAFFEHAVAQGARIKSPPMLFPEYHATFYAAMVLDPDGHNIEVVCHEEEHSAS